MKRLIRFIFLLLILWLIYVFFRDGKVCIEYESKEWCLTKDLICKHIPCDFASVSDDNVQVPINTWLVEYIPWNIVYVDGDGKKYSWIWRIIFHSSHKDIEMLDRNLWATSNDINSPTSYGQYFQWWNNYWFPSNTWAIKTTNKRTNVSSYKPSSFSNGIFFNWEYWEWISYDTVDWVWENLWWWWTDSRENNFWIDTITSDSVKQRKWPCPEWYHVPSLWEWWQLLAYWLEDFEWAIKDKKCVSDDPLCYKRLVYNDVCKEQRAAELFANLFKLPQAWQLIFYNFYRSPGFYFWTSSYRFQFEWADLSQGSFSPLWEPQYSHTKSIRCFADSNFN